jgi:hypothetical protein
MIKTGEEGREGGEDVDGDGEIDIGCQDEKSGTVSADEDMIDEDACDHLLRYFPVPDFF